MIFTRNFGTSQVDFPSLEAHSSI